MVVDGLVNRPDMRERLAAALERATTLADSLRELRVGVTRKNRHGSDFHDIPLLVAKWLGRQDSNLRMAGSKPAALPLGYTP